MCSGSMGGLLSFINTPDGWEYLMSKDWLTDVQTASKQYKGVAGKGHGQKQKLIRVWDLFLFFSFF